MELTQQIECTQKLCESYSERSCSDQVGFLGICGSKYPVKKGPNKIGRDPQTCNIVLNLNSISRQHAVINVLSNHECMLMDLDSANKTKLEDKTLQPYIPHPLRNGDTVHFGLAFGIFRLLEDDNELPMTQALEIPETPICTKYVSKINHVTTIPESPDVSDRDESFIALSQPKSKEDFKSPSANYLKTTGKVIKIQPIGLKKIDNIYWNSSKKSDSFNAQLNGSIGSVNNSVISVKSSDASAHQTIHELETQVPNICDDSSTSIYEANTQIPENPSSPYIHGMDTQVPGSDVPNTQNAEMLQSPNIYNMATQVPIIDKLPKVLQVNNFKEVQLDLFTDNKENNTSIYNAETQQFLKSKKTNDSNPLSRASNTSDDVILFDEIDNQSLEDCFESQGILPSNDLMNDNDLSNQATNSKSNLEDSEEVVFNKNAKRKRLNSDSSTDCEDFDILPTQVITETSKNDEDITDCEDEVESLDKNKNIENKSKIIHIKNFDELETQVLDDDVIDTCLKPIKDKNIAVCNFEEMLTQVIPEDDVQQNMEVDLEDMPTQVIEPIILEKPLVKNKEVTKDFDLFKVPLVSPRKSKKRDSQSKSINNTVQSKNLQEDSNFYKATQDILEDLCTQTDLTGNALKNTSNDSIEENSSVEQFVSGLSSQDIREVVGVECKAAKLKKIPSDGSDIEVTPRKGKPFQFMEIDLPNSQEIKTSVYIHSKPIITDSSSDSDTEGTIQHATPILFKTKKKKKSITAKLDLSKKFNGESLPSRVITRVRKPNKKLLNSFEQSKDIKSILKPTFITDQEEEIDNEIIHENITRLKNKPDRNKKIEGNKRDRNDIDNKIKTEKNKAKENNTNEKPLQETVTSEKRGLDKPNSASTVPRKRGRKKKETIDVTEVKVDTSQSKTEKETSHNEIEKRTRNLVKRLQVENPPEIEKEVRRSKRHITKKTAIETIETDNSMNSLSRSSNRSTKLEQSTVYNMSCDRDSLKRAADIEFVVPSKRSRPTNSLAASRRATPARTRTQYVLLTAFPSDEVKSKLENLGAVLVSDVAACTVVLTLQIKRTFKLLCAVGLRKPIVGPSWVQACVDTKMIVDPWLYLIKDETTERRFHFELKKSLVSKRPFLKGYNVSSTPGVLPSAPEMKLIVECSGGTWKEGGTNWICISSSADKALWPSLKKKGATVVSTEFILGGVLRQKLEIDKNKIA